MPKEQIKMLPNAIESERAVLNSILLNPSTLSVVSDALDPDDFYKEAHRLIFMAMLALDARRTEIDTITVMNEVRRMNTPMEEDVSYQLRQLIHCDLHSGELSPYIQEVRETRQLRNAIEIGIQLASSAMDYDIEAIERAAAALHRVEQGKQLSHVTTLADAATRYIDKLTRLQEQRKENKVSGIPTGFTGIDRLLGGLQPSDLITLAARPSVGKTSMALNMAQQIASGALKRKYNVMIFSLEMSEEQLVQRLFSFESGIDQGRLRLGEIEDHEWDTLIQVGAKLSEEHVWIDDTAAISTEKVRSRARRIQSTHGLDLVIIDYMQLMKTTERHANRQEEVSEISKNLKAIAKDLNVPVVALAQLSRTVEQRQVKIPQLSDLRESGSIEQDSDVVIFLYRDDDLIVSPMDGSYLVNVFVAKHRNGAIGTSQLRFIPYLTQFMNIEDYSKLQMGEE